MHKNVFIDGHERPDVVEDWNCFLTKMEKLKLYMVEFNKDGVIKAKDYPVNYPVERKEYCSIIIFFANDRI